MMESTTKDIDYYALKSKMHQVNDEYDEAKVILQRVNNEFEETMYHTNQTKMMIEELGNCLHGDDTLQMKRQLHDSIRSFENEVTKIKAKHEEHVVTLHKQLDDTSKQIEDLQKQMEDK